MIRNRVFLGKEKVLLWHESAQDQRIRLTFRVLRLTCFARAAGRASWWQDHYSFAVWSRVPTASSRQGGDGAGG